MHTTTLPSPATYRVIWIRNSKQDLENFRESILKGDVLLQKNLAFTCTKIFQQNIMYEKHIRKFSDFWGLCISLSWQTSNLTCLITKFPSCYFSLHFVIQTQWNYHGHSTFLIGINWAKPNYTLSYPIFVRSSNLRRAFVYPSSRL